MYMNHSVASAKAALKAAVEGGSMKCRIKGASRFTMDTTPNRVNQSEHSEIISDEEDEIDQESLVPCVNEFDKDDNDYEDEEEDDQLNICINLGSGIDALKLAKEVEGYTVADKLLQTREAIERARISRQWLKSLKVKELFEIFGDTMPKTHGEYFWRCCTLHPVDFALLCEFFDNNNDWESLLRDIYYKININRRETRNRIFVNFHSIRPTKDLRKIFNEVEENPLQRLIDFNGYTRVAAIDIGQRWGQHPRFREFALKFNCSRRAPTICFFEERFEVFRRTGKMTGK